MVLPTMDGSSVNVTCPVAGPFDNIEWFSVDGNMSTSMATGVQYSITSAGSYYCQVTEQRGIYRSNTFTVFAVGKVVFFT